MIPEVGAVRQLAFQRREPVRMDTYRHAAVVAAVLGSHGAAAA